MMSATAPAQPQRSLAIDRSPGAAGSPVLQTMCRHVLPELQFAGDGAETGGASFRDVADDRGQIGRTCCSGSISRLRRASLPPATGDPQWHMDVPLGAARDMSQSVAQ
jgi:hypothetical protein